MLEGIARWSYRRRWWMLLIWIVFLVAALSLQGAAGGDYSEDFSLPGADSQEAFDLLDERFPEFAGDTADIVFKAEQGVTDPEIQSAMEGLFAEVAEVDLVDTVESPYSEQGQGQVSPDDTIAFAT